VGNELIRVGLTADGSQLRISPVDGLSVVESNGTTTTLPGGHTGWRLWPTGSALQLQQTTGSGWTPFAVSGSTNLASPVRFTAPGNPIRVWRADGTSRDYRGTLSAITSGASVVTVDTLPMESYLRGVVPQESPASWQPAALQAQAVATRTYAMATKQAAPSIATSDICDTTACQVFSGTATYTASGTRTSYCQDLWMKKFDHAALVASPGVRGVSRSVSLPRSNFAPARTRATRCGALTARQRCWAASISLNAIAMPAALEPGPLVTLVR